MGSGKGMTYLIPQISQTRRCRRPRPPRSKLTRGGVYPIDDRYVSTIQSLLVHPHHKYEGLYARITTFHPSQCLSFLPLVIPFLVRKHRYSFLPHLQSACDGIFLRALSFFSLVFLLPVLQLDLSSFGQCLAHIRFVSYPKRNCGHTQTIYFCSIVLDTILSSLVTLRRKDAIDPDPDLFELRVR